MMLDTQVYTSCNSEYSVTVNSNLCQHAVSVVAVTGKENVGLYYPFLVLNNNGRLQPHLTPLWLVSQVCYIWCMSPLFWLTLV